MVLFGRTPTRANAAASCAAFTVLELLLSLGIGLALCLAILQQLLLHGRLSERMLVLLRQRAVQHRTLELIRGELLQAEGVRLPGDSFIDSPCGLNGRRAVLQIQLPQGAITYALGAPPSPIWKAQVLMRCGPAYGLDGQLGSGAFQNRVLADGLRPDGLLASSAGAGQLLVVMKQEVEAMGSTIQHSIRLPLQSIEAR